LVQRALDEVNAVKGRGYLDKIQKGGTAYPKKRGGGKSARLGFAHNKQYRRRGKKKSYYPRVRPEDRRRLNLWGG